MLNQIEVMIKIFQTYEVDWMGDKINNLASLTRHHITKREHGGESSINNYALLTKNSHRLLHYFEQYYPKEYHELNALFLKLNRSGQPPTIEYYEEVREIVKRVKKRIKNANHYNNKTKKKFKGR